MTSTISKRMVFENGVMRIIPMEHPNYCGISNIGFIWRNTWCDPALEYKGQIFNVNDVEETMWCLFLEDGGQEKDDNGFVQYVFDNKEEVYALLDDEIERRNANGTEMEVTEYKGIYSNSAK